MKKGTLFVAVILLAGICGCGSSSSSGNAYSTFGQTTSNAIPAGLKAGGANANIAVAMLMKDLTGECLASYTDCPDLTAANGGDSNTGEILMRLWALDYGNACTDELIAAGTCFECEDCGTGYNNRFYKPTMISAPTTCATTSSTSAKYVNMGVDPCFFDTIVGNISNIAACETVAGGSVDISTAVPWYASWGIPQTIDFSSYNLDSSGRNIWWTVNNGAAGTTQYFFSLDSSWLYVGLKDTSADTFLFLGTGSPAYYQAEATAGGYTTGVNISAYAGTLSAIPAQFEAAQIRVQDPHKYIERMTSKVTSNGSYLWYQSWSKSDGTFPETPADVATYKNSPSTNRCVQIGDSVGLSKYVPLETCVTEFGKTSIADLNMDSNYTLKVIDGETASAISFTTSLTPTVSSTACLPETPAA